MKGSALRSRADRVSDAASPTPRPLILCAVRLDGMLRRSGTPASSWSGIARLSPLGPHFPVPRPEVVPEQHHVGTEFRREATMGIVEPQQLRRVEARHAESFTERLFEMAHAIAYGGVEREVRTRQRAVVERQDATVARDAAAAERETVTG